VAREPELTDDDLAAISRAVAEAESRTAGEICVHVAERLGLFESVRSRARREFYRLNVDRTADRTGILLFLALTPRRFEIVADEGINARVEPDTWDEVARALEQDIHVRGLGPAIVATIARVGEILARHVPPRPDDRNELPNEITTERS
jgi:uncharacterized membrane protein